MIALYFYDYYVDAKYEYVHAHTYTESVSQTRIIAE